MNTHTIRPFVLAASMAAFCGHGGSACKHWFASASALGCCSGGLRPGPCEATPRFDITMNNAPAAAVFAQLVSNTRYNMLVSPDVTGNVSLSLRDTTVMEALMSLRDLYGYDYKVQGNRITVFSNAVQTRLYRINYLPGRRQGLQTSVSLPAPSPRPARAVVARLKGATVRPAAVVAAAEALARGQKTRPMCARLPTLTSGAKCKPH